jgi:GTP-binding protein
MEKEQTKTVVIIGRPNVGKSTLFNRLVGKRIAIETPIAGTTRDRLIEEIAWNGTTFNLVDVAGIEFGSKKEIDQSVQAGVNFALEHADLILFIVDWEQKENQIDKKIAKTLRAQNKKVILAINKADNLNRQQQIDEFKRLGINEIVPVSAISGKSSGDLLDIIIRELESTVKAARTVDIIRADIELAIIGRPNVGKSTLLNSIIGDKRAIVSSEAGTTRDIVSVDFYQKGKHIRISDTAGLRRPGKVEKDTIESFSVLRTYRALSDCDVSILVIDASEGLVALDINILGHAKEMGKGIILAVNKIDMIEGDKNEYMAQMLWQLQGKLNFAPWLPVVFISAQEKENTNSLLNQVVSVSEARNTIIPEEELRQIINQARNDNFQLQNIQTISQKKANPPIFEIVVPAKKPIHYTQIRYLENRIRDFYPMSGTPVFIDTNSVGKPLKKKR